MYTDQQIEEMIATHHSFGTQLDFPPQDVTRALREAHFHVTNIFPESQAIAWKCGDIYFDGEIHEVDFSYHSPQDYSFTCQTCGTYKKCPALMALVIKTFIEVIKPHYKEREGVCPICKEPAHVRPTF